MSKHGIGRLGLIIVTIIWGSSFAVNQLAMVAFTPYQLITLRFGLAFILMTIFFWKHLKEATRSAIVRGIVMGGLLFCAYLFQTVALVYTTPAKNAFLTAFNVVLVPFICFVFLKQQLYRKDIIGAICALVGIGIMSLTDFTAINLGDILTLIGAIFFALHIIYTSTFVKLENAYVLTVVQMGTAFLCSGISAFIKGDEWNFANSQANLTVVYLAIVCTMIAYLIQTLSQRYTTRTETAIILSMESVFGLVFSMIIVKEVITFRLLLGAALILAGVLLVELLPSRKKNGDERVFNK